MEETITYSLNKSVMAIHYEYLHGKKISSISKQTHFLYSLWLIAGLSALYVSIITEHALFSLFFVIVVAVTIGFFLQNLYVKKNLLANALANTKEKTVEIILSEDGMKEIACGIISFAPWSSIKKVEMYKYCMFLQMANGLWAIIPPVAFNQRPDLHEKILGYYRANS